MPDEPYRCAPPQTDDELARLAREGQMRIEAAKHGRSEAARVGETKHLRVAIGAVRGSPIKRVLIGFIALGLSSIATGIALSAATNDATFVPFIPVGFLTAFGSFMFFVFVPPLASMAQVEEERRTIASLPFPIDGYFDVLSAEPRALARLEVGIAFADPMAAEPQTVQGLMGLLDTDAQVGRSDGTTVTVTTGQISGITGIRINGVPVYRNHRMSKYLRNLVEQVLLPLHRSRPLARVRIARTH